MNPFQNFHTTHTIKTFLKIVGQKTTILYLGLTSTVLSKNIMLLLPFMHSVHRVYEENTNIEIRQDVCTTKARSIYY